MTQPGEPRARKRLEGAARVAEPSAETQLAEPVSAGVRIGAALTVLAVVALAAVECARRGFFFSDDFPAFYLSTTAPSLLDFAVTPIDVHWVPLHRLTSALFFRLLGFDYGASVLVLAGLHLLSTVFLWRALKLLTGERWALAFAVVYGTHLFVPSVLIWWTAGIHRIPVALLSFIAIEQYLRLRRRPVWRHAVGCLAAAVLAFGFHYTAMLVPPALVALEAMLWRVEGRPPRRAVKLLVAVMAVGVAGAAVVAHHAQAGWPSEPPPPILPELLYYSGREWLRGLFLILAWPESDVVDALVLTLALLWVGFTLYKIRGSAAGWWAVLAFFTLRVVLLARSHRAVAFGLGNAFSQRYYFEQTGFLIVVACLATYQAVRRSSMKWQRRVDGALPLVATAYAAGALLATPAIVAGPVYTVQHQGRAFVDHLVASAQAENPPLLLRCRSLPPFLVAHYWSFGDPAAFLRSQGITAACSRRARRSMHADGTLVVRRR